MVPGLMVPKEMEVKKRKRDNARVEVSEGGSATLRELDVLWQAKDADKKAEAARLEGKRAEAEAKKHDALRSDESIKYWYATCIESGRCGCGYEPCCVAKFKRCGTCKAIKPGLCKVRACVAARKGGEGAIDVAPAAAARDPTRGLLGLHLPPVPGLHTARLTHVPEAL